MQKIFLSIFVLSIVFIAPNAYAQDAKQNLISNTVGLGGSLLGCSGAINGLLQSITKKSVSESGKVPIKDAVNDKRTDCLDAVAYRTAGILIDRITRQTVNWANNGFNKKGPFYVDNSSYIKGIQNQLLYSSVNSLRTTAKDDGNPFWKTFSKQLVNSASSSLQNNVRNDIYQTDKTFAQGNNFSWNSWNRMLLNPANNPLGYAIVATNEINKEKDTAVGFATQQLLQGNGFAADRKCVNPADYKELSEVQTRTIQFNISQIQSIMGKTTDPASLANLQANLDNNMKQLGNGSCKQWQIRTPGKVIADTLIKNTGNQTERLQLVSKANQSIALIIDAALNGILNWGLNSLSDSNSQGYADFNDPNQAKLATQQIFEPAQIEVLLKIGNRTDNTGTIQIQQDYVKYLKVVVNPPNDLPLTSWLEYYAEKADFCIPGPRPDALQALAEKVGINVEGISKIGTSFWGSLLNTIDILGIEDAVKAGRTKDQVNIFNAYANYIRKYYDVSGNQYYPTNFWDGKKFVANKNNIYSLYANMPDLKTRVWPIIRQKDTREEQRVEVLNEITAVENATAQLSQICDDAKAIYTQTDSNTPSGFKYPSFNSKWKNVDCTIR